jgi:uncharacterized membrane protein YqiK
MTAAAPVPSSSIDTLRAIFTYLIALVVVIGGGLFLFLTRAEPAAQTQAVVIAGFMGSALTFVFGSEVQTRTARQAAASTAAAVATNGHG